MRSVADASEEVVQALEAVQAAEAQAAERRENTPIEV